MRFFVWILTIILFMFSFPQYGQAKVKELPNVSAESAVLMEKETGRVLFEHAANEKKNIASITKIMTAIVAIQYGNLDKEVKASKKAVFTQGSSIYLEINEKMTLRDLLYGLMLRSGNDAAVAIAEHVGGSEEGFVYLMNETAQSLGMTDTHFMNAHGLDDESHYSTAYDMALLMQYAMGNDEFIRISGETSYKSDKRHYAWQNKNKLLTKLYEPCTGGKTGYTRQAGRTLVTSAEQDGLSLIAVTLNDPDDWNDHINLYNYGFRHYSLEKIESKGKKEYQLHHQQVSGYIQEDVFIPLSGNELKSIKKHVEIFKNSTEDKAGLIRVTGDDEEIASIPLYKDSTGYFDRFIYLLLKMIGIDPNG